MVRYLKPTFCILYVIKKSVLSLISVSSYSTCNLNDDHVLLLNHPLNRGLQFEVLIQLCKVSLVTTGVLCSKNIQSTLLLFP